MDLSRVVYSRDLKIAAMRALDAGSAVGEIARKYQLSPKLLERWRGEPRRSARMTHLCSDRVTHTKNTICPRARRGQQFHPRRQACGLFFCHPRRRRVKCSARGKASVRRGKPTTAPLLAKRFAPALPVGKNRRLLAAKSTSLLRGAG